MTTLRGAAPQSKPYRVAEGEKRPGSRVERIAALICDINAFANDVNILVSGIADRVCGIKPAAETAKPKPEIQPNGMLDAILINLSEINTSLDRINSELSRLVDAGF